MRIRYEKETDALAIDFRDAEYDESEEIYGGFVIDFDKSGRPMGIESSFAIESNVGRTL